MGEGNLQPTPQTRDMDFVSWETVAFSSLNCVRSWRTMGGGGYNQETQTLNNKVMSWPANWEIWCKLPCWDMFCVPWKRDRLQLPCIGPSNQQWRTEHFETCFWDIFDVLREFCNHITRSHWVIFWISECMPGKEALSKLLNWKDLKKCHIQANPWKIKCISIKSWSERLCTIWNIDIWNMVYLRHYFTV